VRDSNLTHSIDVIATPLVPTVADGATLVVHHDVDAPSPVLQLAMATAITAAASMEARHSDEDDSDDDRVDEEIVVDSPPVSVTRDTAPPATTPAVCRFASPPLVFQRARQSPPPRPLPTVARPRTPGEFLTAAKSRSDALLQTPAVRRKLVELNFQPRRSLRIDGNQEVLVPR
jgi:hypothetical protein